jgi:hypothetical protein
MEQQVKLLPYGVADFVTVIEQNLYYVDKTMFIPELEKQPRNLFFIRPRRFGKSIFLSMLYSYYDCTQSHKFQSLFGNLWIGQHPTPLQGKYQVLFLDFSQITGNIDKLETKFNSYLSINLDAFVRQYSEYYQAEMEEILAQEDFEEKMELIFKAAKAHQYHLYLIIDEYDNFTNVILNERGEKVYHAITHADGFYRDVFKKFKGNFERIFMMGVSPVTLDDVTSGFNIGWNISIKPEFDEMLGFSTTDVMEMFTQSSNGCRKYKITQMMKPKMLLSFSKCLLCLKGYVRVRNDMLNLIYLINAALSFIFFIRVYLSYSVGAPGCLPYPDILFIIVL